MDVCVYCASSCAVHEEYFNAARRLGQCLAGAGHRIIYGAGAIGLMGALARAALQKGGLVTGVIPSFLNDLGLAEPALTGLIVTADMRERKRRMEEMADGFIACPGGFGTLEEIFEIVTLKQLGRLNKPCVLLNTRGYYDQTIGQIERAIAENFIKAEYRDLWRVADTPEAAVHLLETCPPFEPSDKWFNPGERPATLLE